MRYYLSGREIRAIYSSSLRRARQTAGIVAEAGEGTPEQLTVREEDDLREIDHGSWSGLTRGEVEERWSQLAGEWRARPAAVRMPDGESLQDVRERALRFLDRLRHSHADGSILVITHGTVVRLLLAHFLAMDSNDIWRFELDNAGLTVVEDHEPPFIMAINHTGHLKGLRSRLNLQVR